MKPAPKPSTMMWGLTVLHAYLIGCLILLLHVGVVSGGQHRHPPSTIVCYLHIERNVDFVELANTSVSSGIDALLRGIAVPMTTNSSNQSQSLGFVRGITLQTSSVATSSPPNREQLFETLDYDDGVYNGTICFHGQISFPPTSSSEVAIVGGTGAFRRVQGYASPTLISSPSSSTIVFRWELHLYYPPPHDT